MFLHMISLLSIDIPLSHVTHEKLTELLEQSFNRDGSLCLACNEKLAFLLLNNLKDVT